MDHLDTAALSARHRHLIDTCQPYLMTARSNLGALNLAPFGLAIREDRIFDPTRLSSGPVIEALHAMDAFSFGDQAMLMPRWVLFDCGEFPGLIFGFGRPARDLPVDVRRAYKVEGRRHDEDFIPLSMWIAIRCAEQGAWFGHNLASANLVARAEPLDGLATLTKAFGLLAARAERQYGATQWASASLNIHLGLGRMRLLGAYTPAHTHPETLVYRIDVDPERVAAPLKASWRRRDEGGDRFVDADDTEAIKALHADLEAGQQIDLLRAERRAGLPNRLWLLSHPG